MIIFREPIEENDSLAVANVLKDSYNINSVEEGVSVFKSEINKEHNYIVAIKDNEIIGIASWKVHDLPKHCLAELSRIAVLPSYRGKGVAKELFEALKIGANEFYKSNGFELRKLYLLTHASNKRAQSFYSKLGFKHETTLKDHYYKGEDELVFSLFFD